MRETHPSFTRRRFFVGSTLALAGAVLGACAPEPGTETAAAALTPAPTVAWTNTKGATVSWESSSSIVIWSES